MTVNKQYKIQNPEITTFLHRNVKTIKNSLFKVHTIAKNLFHVPCQPQSLPIWEVQSRVELLIQLFEKKCQLSLLKQFDTRFVFVFEIVPRRNFLLHFFQLSKTNLAGHWRAPRFTLGSWRRWWWCGCHGRFVRIARHGPNSNFQINLRYIVIIFAKK